MTRHAYFPGIADQESTLERLERAAIAGKLDRRSFLKAAAAAGASAIALPALAETQIQAGVSRVAQVVHGQVSRLPADLGVGEFHCAGPAHAATTVGARRR